MLERWYAVLVVLNHFFTVLFVLEHCYAPFLSSVHNHWFTLLGVFRHCYAVLVVVVVVVCLMFNRNTVECLIFKSLIAVPNYFVYETIQ